MIRLSGAGQTDPAATLGLSPPSAAPRGTGRAVSRPCPGSRSRTGTSHPRRAPRRHVRWRPGGSPTGPRCARSSLSSPVMWERATPWRSPRGRPPWSWPWGSSACHPGRACSSRHWLVRRRTGHRARRSPARARGRLDAHGDAVDRPRSARQPLARKRDGRPVSALVIGHWAGDPADVAALAEAAGLPSTMVVEDAAQGLGGILGGRTVGGAGTACFSFYTTTNLPVGEGGMVTTDDPERAERLRAARMPGEPAPSPAWRSERRRPWIRHP